MAELDRFERRLATGLERLADEVPTAVDAAAVAHAIATTEAQGRGWARRLAGAGPGAQALAPALRFALAPVALLLLVFGIVVLAERLAPEPSEGVFAGQATCDGEPWTSAGEAVSLDCLVELANPRLAGSMRLVTDPASGVAGYAVRTGSLELRGPDATWTGAVLLEIGPNGLAIGTARLSGTGGAEGMALDVHMLSADGIDWGVLATVVAAPGADSGGDR